MNSVNVIGRLVRDPEVRYTITGKSVCDFTVAVSKRIKPTDGSPDADFFRVTAWGQTADFVSQYVTKGRLVAVTGRLQSRKWTDKDGGNRESVEIVADQVNGLDRPRDEDPKAGGAGTATAQPAATASTTENPEWDPFLDD